MMSAIRVPKLPAPLALALGWRRLRFTVLFSLGVGLLMSLGWKSNTLGLLVRTVTLGVIGLLVFGLFEQWPKRLPPWLARWVLQVIGVAVAMPIATATIYALSTEPGAPAFFHDKERMEGFSALCGVGIFLSPWVALAALVRQKEAMARHQALTFELQRSELERQALDARLNLLQAQVAPHFLFNTLANVQALVDAGSPQASTVLRSLIAYLRAAVPRLHEPATTFGQELQLVQAYLELMRMRMPDRLHYTLQVDEETRTQRCPPMTLLTLVENAVRHGIDPSEDGGCIDVRVQRHGNRILVRVSDTGVGFQASDRGLGTGLAALRERLQLVFGDTAALRVMAQQPTGVRAEIDLPATEAGP